MIPMAPDYEANSYRGVGLMMGHLIKYVEKNALYQSVVKMMAGRSIVTSLRRYNLFLIMEAMSKQGMVGDIIEFGSYRGGNAIFMAAVAKALLPGTRVFALDTFRGMPVSKKGLDHHKQGDFSDVDFNELEKLIVQLGLGNLVLVRGMFQDTAGDVFRKTSGVALAYIDCDIYSSVSYAYDVVGPHMVKGGYVVFDDALGPQCMGATKAVIDLAIRRDAVDPEQIYPCFVFRAG